MLPRDVRLLAADSLGEILASDGQQRLARLTGGWLSNLAPLPNESRISDVIAFPSGGFAIADAGLNRIWRLDSGQRLVPFAGSEQPRHLDRKPGRSDGTVDSAMFRWPSAIAVASSGGLIIAEPDGNRSILRLVSDGMVTSADSDELPPHSITRACALDRDRLAVLVDVGSSCVFVVRQSDAGWRHDGLAGSLTERGTADGPAADARFVGLASLSASARGCLVADGARLRHLDNELSVTTVAGSFPGFADGPGSTASFGRISAIAASSDGWVFVADPENDALRLVSPDGVVTTNIGALRNERISTGEAASLSRSFGNALVDDDTREAWGIARTFLRDHRAGAEAWPDRTVHPTSVASARLGKGLAEEWSRSEDPDRSSVGAYCLWLIGCDERAGGINEIRDHRLRRIGDELADRAH